MTLLINNVINIIVISVVFSAYVNCLENGTCKTPNGELADCISIYNCTIMLEAIKTEDRTILEFVKDSQCGYQKTPLVCCGNKTTYATALLPSRAYCGYQHSDDYVSTTGLGPGKSTIDEFPWIAALYYSEGENSSEVHLCAGTLINNRYILTAAHCLLIREAYLKRVRLGEYNIEEKDDCVTQGDFNVCSDPTADFEIHSYEIHKGFNRRKRLNDIGLIRLKTEVLYSDFIRPICLPLPEAPSAKVGDTLLLTGWGRSSFRGNATKIKKKTTGTIISTEECNKVYHKWTAIDRNQHLCTISNPNDTVFTCAGDSGSAVMFQKKHQWFLEGIVQFGLLCGYEIPDVQVNVRNYVPWILKHIHP